MSLTHPLIPELPTLGPLVQESWRRSLQSLAGFEKFVPPLAWESRELAELRRGHPLAAVMPVISKLLIQPTHDTGLLVAVADEHGRLLWVEGDPATVHLGENINFAAGADWSEKAAGTSAPGTALVLGKSVQIMGREHFNPAVHSWNCTAVPIHDPDSGFLLGVVDITGGLAAVGANTLSLVQATVAAAEAQLRIHHLERRASAGRQSRTAPRTPLYRDSLQNRDSLQILGRDQGLLQVAGEAITLSGRHTEILAVLALHPQGLTAEELSAKIYPEGTSGNSIRAELVRLRKLLSAVAPTLIPESRPYRLPRALALDAEHVSKYLSRGAHRLALNQYPGEVLPRSVAPELVGLRSRLAIQLREAILSDAGPDALLSYLQLPEAADDVDAWRTALRLLPPRSPRRNAVVAHVEALHSTDSQV